METTNEILDSTSHDCPLVTQAYGAAVPKGPHVPSSPTALGKGRASLGRSTAALALTEPPACLLHSGAGPAALGPLW